MKRRSKSNIEKLIENAVRKAGSKGILQSELWKKLGINSRDGVKVLSRLVRKGVIAREPVGGDSKRRTYRLFIVEKPKEEKKRVEIKLDTLLEVPCFTCKHLRECGGHNRWDPSNCQLLDEWIQRKILEMRSRST